LLLESISVTSGPKWAVEPNSFFFFPFETEKAQNLLFLSSNKKEKKQKNGLFYEVFIKSLVLLFVLEKKASFFENRR